MVRVHPDPPDSPENGGLAQLGEHLLCKQGVNGSIPLSSTNIFSIKDNIDVVRKKLEVSVQLNIYFWFLTRLFFNKMEEVK